MEPIRIVTNKASILNYVGHVAMQLDSGIAYEVIIQETRKERTLDQNTHFHSHIQTIVRETGNSFDQMKMQALLLACKHYNYPYVYVDGILYPLSTRNRSTREMASAIEASHMLAMEAEVFLEEKEW